MILVERGIEMPLTQENGLCNEILEAARNMEIGDSFLLPDKTATLAHGNLVKAKKVLGFSFVCRKEGSGVRVWRKS